MRLESGMRIVEVAKGGTSLATNPTAANCSISKQYHYFRHSEPARLRRYSSTETNWGNSICPLWQLAIKHASIATDSVSAVNG